MKKLVLFIFVLYGFASFAQGEANNWYFGNYAGLDFSSSPPTVLTDGQLSTLEGCTTISDSNGNLLFYTDGSTVYNRYHQVMQNGTGLKGHNSSTASALIVPQPGSNHIYYIFTVDEPHHLNADDNENISSDDGVNDGFMYSVVDMDLANGNGAVVPAQKNTQLYTYDPDDQQETAYKCSEKITAVKSDNCSSFWVITHFIDSFYAFEVGEDGINEDPVVSTVGVTVPLSGYRRNALGYMKSSPQGDKIAIAHLGLTTQTGGEGPGKLALYDFDNATGTVSNELALHDGDSPYGVEFSASGDRLYTSINEEGAINGYSFVLQYDLTLPEAAIANSAYLLENEDGETHTLFNAGALQLGPDGRIYRGLYNLVTDSGDYLGVIKNPEALAANLDYTESELLVNIDGNRQSHIGLPPFIQSIFASVIDIVHLSENTVTQLPLCNGESYTLYYDEVPGATYNWYKDDVLLTNESSASLEVGQPAGVSLPYTENYRLEMDLNDGSCPFIGVAEVTYHPNPETTSTPQDLYLCDDDLEAGVLVDFTSVSQEILQTQPDGFQVKYFATQEDAHNGTNEFETPHSTSSHEEEVFLRIENQENPSCYAVQQFTVFGFEKPMVNTAETIAGCDPETGASIFFDLYEYVDAVIENPDETIFDKNFFYSLDDAENGINAITTPENTALDNNSGNLFFKIENTAHTACMEIVEIPVSINSLPEAQDAQLLQCYIDNAGAVSLFDLTEAKESLTVGNPDMTVEYFSSFYDAEMSENAISNPEAYSNTTNPQTIFSKVKNPITGCSTIVELELVLSMTEANDATLSTCDDDGVQDGFNNFTLSEALPQLLENQPQGLSVEMYASMEDALLQNNPLPENYNNTTAYTQTVFARVSNGTECYAINEVQLYVHELPQLPPNEEITYCTGNFPEPLILEADGFEDEDQYNYSWAPGGETTPTIQVNEPGTYQVTVTNIETQCTNSRQIVVSASNIAIVEQIQVTGIEYNNTINIQLSEENTGDYEFALNNAFGPYQDHNKFKNLVPGIHSVYVRDKNGCGIEEIEVYVVGFPKFFTPNNDGHNDYWQVLGVGEFNEGNCKINIFDRYGKLLCQLDPQSQGWDGTYNGKNMPSNDYWYRVELEDGRIYRGHFTLKR